MKKIDEIIYLAGIALSVITLPFVIRSCSIAQSNRPYMQGEYKGAHYSFAQNGLFSQTYKITLKDGTKLRCDDMGFAVQSDIIDSVIVYDKDNKISKIYENTLKDEDVNDEFLNNLTDQVRGAKRYIEDSIRNYKEREIENGQRKIKDEQIELITKVKGEN